MFDAAERAQSRFARIEAAEHNETRGDRWLISRLSPDSQLELDMETARDRSRDLYQNDALGGAIDGKVNHVIGTGHTPQARIKDREGVVTEAEAEEYNEQLEQVYEDWSPCADRNGRSSLWMISRLAARHNEFDGESFTVFSDVGRADKPIPLALQVIDPERVHTPAKFAGDPLVRLGIRYSQNGEILGYYVQKSHPGDTKNASLEYDFVTSDRMLHVFEPWFAEQSRGLPWMVRALNRARDAKDFDEATILKCQVEACYAVFVKPGMGGNSFLSAQGRSSGTNAAGRRMQDITPGSISYLEQGEEIAFASPQSPGNSFGPFMEWCYRRVAAAINWPYEMIAKNWNGLSFAAGRLVLTDAKKATEVGQQIMKEQWFTRVWNRMVDECVILGEVDIEPLAYLEFPNVFRRHAWIPPKWDYAINPGEEIDADVTEINENLGTLEDKLGKRGLDLETVIARRKREKKLLAEAGLDMTPSNQPKAAAVPVGRMDPQKPQDTEEVTQDQEEEDSENEIESELDPVGGAS